MKKLIFASILGLALIAFTGCTTSENANMNTKCSASGKCANAKKVTKKCAASGKCDSAKKVAKKCDTGKCGK